MDAPPMPLPSGAEKELKVRLPERLIVRLHSLKILQGQPIRDTMVAALEAYYARPEVRAALRDVDDGAA